MAADKEFLTYNQQMKKLRDKKKIDCGNTKDKTTLVRMGYFNLVNGYKEPFICGKDNNGNHIYIANTSLKALYALKKFDDVIAWKDSPAFGDFTQLPVESFNRISCINELLVFFSLLSPIGYKYRKKKCGKRYNKS